MSSGFSPMTPLGGEVAKMTTRQRSTEADGGGLMERWFRARGGEIRAGVDAVDNKGCSLRAFYRVVVRWKAGGQGEGGSGGGTSMASVVRDGNGEGETIRWGHFQRARGGGGEAVPRCRRWMAQQKAVRRPRILKATADV
jgi:hypothetical protein